MQKRFDEVGRKIGKLQDAYGIHSEKLLAIKTAYEVFLNDKTEDNFTKLEAEVKKLEDYQQPDMSPVFMNI